MEWLVCLASSQFLAEIRVPRQPPLRRQPVNARQKPLESPKVHLAVARGELGAVLVARVMPALRDHRGGFGFIVHREETEAGGFDQPFVLSRRDEEVQSYGT